MVGVKDLNHYPQLQQPLNVVNTKTFGILMFKSKPLTANLALNKQAFVSGESILVSGFVNNESSTKISHCELKLRKHVQYHAKAKTRMEVTVVAHLKHPGVEKASETKWNQVALFVPCLPPSGLDGCNIIDTWYTLEIRIVPPGLAFALELHYPVTIGTLPFRPVLLPPAGATTSGAGYASVPQPHMPPQMGVGAPPHPQVGVGAPAAPGATAPPMAEKGGPPEAQPYGNFMPTYGELCSDVQGTLDEPPSYNSLYQGGEDNEDHDEDSRKYQPRYPTYNMTKQPF